LIQLKQITALLEEYFPLQLAENWDNSGLQLGSRRQEIRKIGLALDLTPDIIQQALADGVDLVVTHHPLLFQAIKSLDYDHFPGDHIVPLVRSGMAVYAAHTNLDSAERSISQYLAEKLDLQDIKPLNRQQREQQYKLVAYVPLDYEIAVREALYAAGAGEQGAYSHCSFTSAGRGRFMGDATTTPFIGQPLQEVETEEYRLEMLCPEAVLNRAMQALRQAHPYEEPAYDIIALNGGGRVFSLGRRGNLSAAMPLLDLAAYVKARLELNEVRYVGPPARRVQKIAVVSGGGASLITAAHQKGCEVLITGDLKYHDAQLAERLNLSLIDAGHQGTEKFVVPLLQEIFSKEFEKKAWNLEIIGYNNFEIIHKL
jgi:dinuclear metal center YbgI/SA1388 family protein